YPLITMHCDSLCCGRAHLLLHSDGALADALAEVGELRAADGAFALDFDFFNAGRMLAENALHAFAVANAADGESGLAPAPAFADHPAGDPRDALLVAFHALGVDAHAAANGKFNGFLPKLLGFVFFKDCLAHNSYGVNG